MAKLALAPRPTPKTLWQRKWVRVSTYLGVVLGALALTYHLALPHIVERIIMGKLSDVIEGSGRRVEWQSFELVALNRYAFHDVVVSDENGQSQQPFVTIGRLTVALDRSRLFTGDVVLREIDLVQPQVFLRDYPDGSSNYGEVWGQLLGRMGLEQLPPTDTTTDPSAETTRRSSPLSGLLALGMPRVTVNGGVIDLSEVEGEDLPAAIRNLTATVLPIENGGRFASQFELGADFDGLPPGPFQRSPERLRIAGHVDPDDDVAEVTIEAAEPVELASVPGLTEVGLRIGQVGFEYPYSFHFGNVELIDRRTRAPVLVVPQLTVTLRELTLDPNALYLSLVQANDVRIYAEVDRVGRSNIARLLGYSGLGPVAAILPDRPDRAALQAEAEAAEPASDNSADALASEDELGGLTSMCEGRRWYECFPQTLDVSNVTMEVIVHDEGRHLRTLDLHIPAIRASQRLLNFQMDLVAEATMSERGVGPVGTLHAELVYFWMSDRWRLDLAFHQFDVNHFLEVSTYPDLFHLSSGLLDGAVTVEDDRPTGGPLRFTGDLSVTNLALDTPAIGTAPVADLTVDYGFQAELDEEGHLTMNRGDLKLGALQADVRIEVADLSPPAAFDYIAGFWVASHDDAYWQARAEEPAPWSTFRLMVDMPRQPVMEVLHSIPLALRTRLGDVQMIGEVGWLLDATAEYRRRDSGRLRVEVQRPATADVLDEGVELLYLPPDVDVRVLNALEGFSFTFVDGIGERRQLATDEANPRWVPLAEISPFMIEAILNTEDQGFFESQGFNWTQLRSVIAYFLAEQEFGRGASTITMQLVKNVFLSRERELSRKLAEMFLTYWTNRLVLKERILEVYLNIIEFGPGINGIAEAAEHYFGKLPADLTLAECIWLVSIVPGPREYHFYYEQGAISDRWWNHMTRYLDRMLAREVISEDDYERAMSTRPEFYLPTEGDPALRPREPEPPLIEIPIFDDFDELAPNADGGSLEVLQQIRADAD